MQASDEAERLSALWRELRCYLAAVEAFRAEGHEPEWLSEARADESVGAALEAPRRYS